MILLTIYAALSIWQIEICVFMSLGFQECYEIMQLRVVFYVDETFSTTNANDCSENTLLSDSSNISTTNQKLSTEVPPKSKSKTFSTKRPGTFNHLPPKYMKPEGENK